MEFLNYGDKPRYSVPLNAWPKYSRVGAPIVDFGGRPPKKVKRLEHVARERRAAIMRDDQEIMELAAIIVGSGILD